MRINLGECLAAAAVIGFGATVAVLGTGYPIGSVAQMGPGYFPVFLGIVTVGLGAATLMAVRKSDVEAPGVPLRAFGLVFAGMIAWVFLAERFGLVPASFALIALTSIARPPVRWVTVLVTSAIVSGFSVLVFIGGFDLPLDAFRW